MKKFDRFFEVFLFLPMILTGCGQPGPLYLPKEQPSVYTEPKPVSAPDEKKEEVPPSAPASPQSDQTPKP